MRGLPLLGLSLDEPVLEYVPQPRNGALAVSNLGMAAFQFNDKPNLQSWFFYTLYFNS